MTTRRKILLALIVMAIPILAVFMFENVSRSILGVSTYYVSQNGGGTSCAALFPCTLSTGMSKMTPGDTLKITGTLKASVTFAKSGTANAHMRLEGGVIDAPHSDQNALLVSGSYVDVANIEVTGGSEFGIRTKGNNLTFSNFSVHDTVWSNRTGDACIGGSGGWGRGMTIGPTSFSIEVSDGKVYRNCGEGLTVTQGHDINIHGVEVYDNFSRGIYIGNAPYITVASVYVHCEDKNFYRSGKPARGIGLAIETTNYSTYHNQLHDIIIRGSTVENCLGTNFYSEVSGQYPSDVLVEGNRYVNVPAPAISIPGTNIVIRDNVIGTATPLASSTSTLTASPTWTQTLTPTASATATATDTPTPSPTPTPTIIPCPAGWEFYNADVDYVYCKIHR